MEAGGTSNPDRERKLKTTRKDYRLEKLLDRCQPKSGKKEERKNRGGNYIKKNTNKSEAEY